MNHTGDLYEAEKAQLGKDLKVASEGKKSDDEQNVAETPQPAQPEDQETTTLDPNRNPFSGEGYVTGFKDDGSSGVKFTVDAPSNQHYDLSFSIASKKIVDCRIVVNGKAEAFYKRHGAKQIERGLEQTADYDGKALMTTRYCLRYELGCCLQGKSQGKAQVDLHPTDGLTLVNNDRRFRLRFDCRNCRMQVCKA